MKVNTFKTTVLAGLIGSGLLGASASPIDAEDLAKYPIVSGVSMSLEGDMLVGLIADPTRDGDGLAAAMWDISGDIDTSKPLSASKVTPGNNKMKFFGASALKAGKSLWFANQKWTGRLAGCGEGRLTGSTKTYVTKLYMGDSDLDIDDLPDGPREKGMTEAMEKCLAINNTTGVVSMLPTDPEHIIINRFSVRDGERYFKHNLRTGKEEFLYQDVGDVEISLVSGSTGQPIVKTELDFTEGDYKTFTYLIDPASGEFTKEDPLTNLVKERYQLEVIGMQGDDYMILTDKFSDKAAIYMYNPATDQFSSEPLFAHPEFSATGVITSSRPDNLGDVLGFRYAGASREVFWIDPQMDSIQKGLEAAFEDQKVTIIDYNNDLSRVLFETSSTTTPPAYMLLVDGARVALVGAERPWIGTEDLRETELVYYTARDGLKIPGLLTLPASLKEGEKARGAVILPHGGPWSRDYAEWDPTGWPQFLASRGYVVLQPQYRGSTDFGRKLWLAGDREWGEAMQDDKDDGAAWLVSQGYVNADKIAIFGYSYGGFAAMAATVRPDSPYQCAIAGAGVSNLTRIANNWGENRVQRTFQGSTLGGMDPADNTEKANIPILVYHGDRDVRVPLFHGRDFYNAVKKQQPESKLVVVRDMPHSLPWAKEHHIETLNEIENYLKTTCGM